MRVYNLIVSYLLKLKQIEREWISIYILVSHMENVSITSDALNLFIFLLFDLLSCSDLTCVSISLSSESARVCRYQLFIL